MQLLIMSYPTTNTAGSLCTALITATPLRSGITILREPLHSTIVTTTTPYYYLQSGKTNTTGALRLTRTKVLIESAGDRKFAPDVVMLITDGKPTLDINGYYDEVLKLKQVNGHSGVTLITCKYIYIYIYIYIYMYIYIYVYIYINIYIYIYIYIYI